MTKLKSKSPAANPNKLSKFWTIHDGLVIETLFFAVIGRLVDNGKQRPHTQGQEIMETLGRV